MNGLEEAFQKWKEKKKRKQETEGLEPIPMYSDRDILELAAQEEMERGETPTLALMEGFQPQEKQIYETPEQMKSRVKEAYMKERYPLEKNPLVMLHKKYPNLAVGLARSWFPGLSYRWFLEKSGREAEAKKLEEFATSPKHYPETPMESFIQTAGELGPDLASLWKIAYKLPKLGYTAAKPILNQIAKKAPKTARWIAGALTSGEMFSQATFMKELTRQYVEEKKIEIDKASRMAAKEFPTGLAVGGVAGIPTKGIAAGMTKFMGEVGALATVPALVHGEKPNLQNFFDALILVTGLKGIHALPKAKANLSAKQYFRRMYKDWQAKKLDKQIEAFAAEGKNKDAIHVIGEVMRNPNSAEMRKLFPMIPPEQREAFARDFIETLKNQGKIDVKYSPRGKKVYEDIKVELERRREEAAQKAEAILERERPKKVTLFGPKEKPISEKEMEALRKKRSKALAEREEIPPKKRGFLDIGKTLAVTKVGEKPIYTAAEKPYKPAEEKKPPARAEVEKEKKVSLKPSEDVLYTDERGVDLGGIQDAYDSNSTSKWGRVAIRQPNEFSKELYYDEEKGKAVKFIWQKGKFRGVKFPEGINYLVGLHRDTGKREIQAFRVDRTRIKPESARTWIENNLGALYGKEGLTLQAARKRMAESKRVKPKEEALEPEAKAEKGKAREIEEKVEKVVPKGRMPSEIYDDAWDSRSYEEFKGKIDEDDISRIKTLGYTAKEYYEDVQKDRTFGGEEERREVERREEMTEEEKAEESRRKQIDEILATDEKISDEDWEAAREPEDLIADARETDKYQSWFKRLTKAEKHFIAQNDRLPKEFYDEAREEYRPRTQEELEEESYEAEEKGEERIEAPPEEAEFVIEEPLTGKEVKRFKIPSARAGEPETEEYLSKLIGRAKRAKNKADFFDSLTRDEGVFLSDLGLRPEDILYKAKKGKYPYEARAEEVYEGIKAGIKHRMGLGDSLDQAIEWYKAIESEMKADSSFSFGPAEKVTREELGIAIRKIEKQGLPEEEYGKEIEKTKYKKWKDWYYDPGAIPGEVIAYYKNFEKPEGWVRLEEPIPGKQYYEAYGKDGNYIGKNKDYDKAKELVEKNYAARKGIAEVPEEPKEKKKEKIDAWEALKLPEKEIKAIPDEVQRYDKEHKEIWIATGKPHGLYTTPTKYESPHDDMGKRKVYKVNKKAKIVTVDSSGIIETTRTHRGVIAGRKSGGIAYLESLIGKKALIDLLDRPKKELIEFVSKDFPNVEWKKYFDNQEILEGYAGLLARTRGNYDAIWAYDVTAPEFSEYIGLSNRAFVQKPKEKKPPKKKLKRGQAWRGRALEKYHETGTGLRDVVGAVIVNRGGLTPKAIESVYGTKDKNEIMKTMRKLWGLGSVSKKGIGITDLMESLREEGVIRKPIEEATESDAERILQDVLSASYKEPKDVLPYGEKPPDWWIEGMPDGFEEWPKESQERWMIDYEKAELKGKEDEFLKRFKAVKSGQIPKKYKVTLPNGGLKVYTKPGLKSYKLTTFASGLTEAEANMLDRRGEVLEEIPDAIGKPGLTEKEFDKFTRGEKLLHIKRRIESAFHVRELNNILKAPKYKVWLMPNEDFHELTAVVAAQFRRIKKPIPLSTKGLLDQPTLKGIASLKQPKEFVIALAPARHVLKGTGIIEGPYGLADADSSLRREWNLLQRVLRQEVFRTDKGKFIDKNTRDDEIIFELLDNPEGDPLWIDRKNVTLASGEVVEAIAYHREAASKLRDIFEDFRIRMGLKKYRKYYISHLSERIFHQEPASSRTIKRLLQAIEDNVRLTKKNYEVGIRYPSEEIRKLLSTELTEADALQIIDFVIDKKPTFDNARRMIDVIQGGATDEISKDFQELYHPFLKERKGKYSKRSALSAIEAYSRYSLKKIHYEPALLKIIPIVETMPGKYSSLFPISTKRTYAEKLISRVIGRPTEADRQLEAIIYHINEAFGGWPRKVPMMKWLFKPRPATRFSTRLNRLQYIRLLGIAFDSSITNLTQAANTIALTGFFNTSKAYARLMTPAGLKAVRAHRVMTEFQGFFGGPQPFYKRPLNTLERLILSPFQVAEFINRGAAYLAGIEEAAAKGLDFKQTHQIGMGKLSKFLEKYAPEDFKKAFFETEAEKFARREVVEAQFGYSAVEMSPMMQTPGGRLLFQFWSYPTQQFSFVYEGLASAIRTRDAMKFLRFAALVGFYTYAAEKIFQQFGIDVSNIWSLRGIMPRSPGPNISLAIKGLEAAGGRKITQRELAREYGPPFLRVLRKRQKAPVEYRYVPWREYKPEKLQERRRRRRRRRRQSR